MSSSVISLVQSVENCVCILRNLSYHVHKEIPGAERFQEPHQLRSAGHQRKKNEADCLGGKRTKGWRSANRTKPAVCYSLCDMTSGVQTTRKSPSGIYYAKFSPVSSAFPYFLIHFTGKTNITTINAAHLGLPGRFFFLLFFN